MDTAAKPITLPPTSKITAIEVTPNLGDSRPTSVITDEDQIDRFVEFVNSRQDGWRQPWDTFPAGRWTVSVKQADNTIAVFWPSSGQIGGREGGQGADSNRLRTLSEKEWSELRAILGIAPDQSPP